MDKNDIKINMFFNENCESIESIIYDFIENLIKESEWDIK